LPACCPSFVADSYQSEITYGERWGGMRVTAEHRRR
jgi:hypothetical protein